MSKYKENINQIIIEYGEKEIKNNTCHLIMANVGQLSVEIATNNKSGLIDTISDLEFLLDELKAIYSIEDNNLLKNKLKISNDMLNSIKIYKAENKEG